MKPSITSIGEILYDIYPDQKRLGGAPFNFIYHIWKILGKANFISSVGNDENGKEMLSYLDSIGFDTKLFTIDNNYPTGSVYVEIDENKIPKYKITYNCSFDHMILNSSGKDALEHDTDIISFGTFTMREEISRNTVLSVFNKPGKKYFSDLNLRHNLYSKDLVEKILLTCNVIKINQEELEKLRNLFSLSGSDNAAVYQLMNNFNLDLIAVTFGEEGAKLYDKDKCSYYKPPVENIIDTLGAGDAFSAIFCLGYLYNIELDELNKLANEFAFKICQVSGALPKDDMIYLPYKKIFC